MSEINRHINPPLGFTKIPNDLLQALSDHQFTQQQLTLMLQLIRRLHGFHKDSDVIASSQLAHWTGLDAANVRRTLSELHRKQVIDRKKIPSPTGHGYSYETRIVSDISQWQIPYRRKARLQGKETEYDYLFNPRGNLGSGVGSDRELTTSQPVHFSNMPDECIDFGMPPRHVDGGQYAQTDSADTQDWDHSTPAPPSGDFLSFFNGNEDPVAEERKPSPYEVPDRPLTDIEREAYAARERYYTEDDIDF